MIRRHLLKSLVLAAGPLRGVTAFAADANPTPLRCQLAVIGGGSGGFGAALAAARLGVDVVLVEKADCLGGTSVRSGVNCWEAGVGGTGIPFDLYRRLKGQPDAVGIYSFGRHASWFDPKRESARYPGGETVIDPQCHYRDTLQRHGTGGLTTDAARMRKLQHGVVFEPQAMADTMRAMLEATGHCRVLLNVAFVDARMEAGRIRQVTLSDARTLVADHFIDATGDALVCVATGCQTMPGQEAAATFGEPDAPAKATTRVNGVSLVFRTTPTAVPGVESLPAGVEERCWWAGRFPATRVNHYPSGDLNMNMLPSMEGAEFVRRGYADALEECRSRVQAHWHHLQVIFPEFQSVRLRWIAPALGIRESRRVVGEYVLTERDLLAGLGSQKHPDLIAVADHAMDTHGSQGGRLAEVRAPYGIQYRCLIPRDRRNLLIACRAASFSSLAASSCRLSRTMMQLGQAAGTAAALAAQLHVDLPDVPTDRLRAELRGQRVQLDHPLPESLWNYLADENG